MSELRDTLYGLFVEIAIIEHLTRKRVERHHMDGMEAGEFGILGYLIRVHGNSDTQRSIAWVFQEDEARVDAQIIRLAGRGYVNIVEAIPAIDRHVSLTEAGQLAHDAALERIAPEFMSMTSEISDEDITTAYRVIRDIRLVMDNLPDR